MKEELKKVIERYAKQAEAIFDSVRGMKIELSKADEIYDLAYISQALTKCTTSMETISDHQMTLMKMDIELRPFEHNAAMSVKLKERSLKDGETYKSLPKDLRSDWLKRQLFETEEDVANWGGLFVLMGMVKEAIHERMQLIKRLDSDVRLHQKLYEQKIAAGMVPKPGLQGKKAPEQSIS